jgi:long-chain acyl-CoA synthetase
LNRGFAVVGKWNGLLLLQRLTAPVDLPPGTAKISFTSGSTGAPKGACLSAVGLMDTASAVARRLAELPIDRHLAVLPLSLLLENTAGIYAPLLRGAEILVPDLPTLGWQGMSGFDPAALQRAVATAAPSSLILVPELLKLWALFLAAAGKREPPACATSPSAAPASHRPCWTRRAPRACRPTRAMA